MLCLSTYEMPNIQPSKRTWASTLLGVSVLGYEGQLVEIEAIAVLD